MPLGPNPTSSCCNNMQCSFIVVGFSQQPLTAHHSWSGLAWIATFVPDCFLSIYWRVQIWFVSKSICKVSRSEMSAWGPVSPAVPGCITIPNLSLGLPILVYRLLSISSSQQFSLRMDGKGFLRTWQQAFCLLIIVLHLEYLSEGTIEIPFLISFTLCPSLTQSAPHIIHIHIHSVEVTRRCILQWRRATLPWWRSWSPQKPRWTRSTVKALAPATVSMTAFGVASWAPRRDGAASRGS